MKIAIYGNAEAAEAIMRLLAASPGYCYQKLSFTRWDNYNNFLREYPKSDAAALLVTADGGEGLETMTAAMALLPDTPRVWFASDKALGAQAFRLGAAYFGEKPMTADSLTQALRRCGMQENYVEFMEKRGTGK